MTTSWRYSQPSWLNIAGMFACGPSSLQTPATAAPSPPARRPHARGAHARRFWDCPSGDAITNASACRDLPWASARVTLGYHCQGVYRSAADATSVHAIDRNADGTLLATVDDLGQVAPHALSRLHVFDRDLPPSPKPSP